MTVSKDDIRAYLVGLVSDEQRERIDEAVIHSTEVFEQVQLEEEELIEAYVTDRLAADVRNSLEKEIIRNAGLGDLVQMQQSLRRLAREAGRGRPADSPSKPFLVGASRIRYQMAAAVVLVGLATGTYLRLNVSREKERIEASRKGPTAGLEPPRVQQPSSLVLPEVPHGDMKASAEAGRLSIPAFLVLPATRGSDPTSTFKVAGNARIIRLRFSVDPDANYKSYRLVIRGKGRQVVNATGLRSRDESNYRLVSVEFPMVDQVAGEYEATVYGIKADLTETVLEDYVFAISLK